MRGDSPRMSLQGGTGPRWPPAPSPRPQSSSSCPWPETWGPAAARCSGAFLPQHYGFLNGEVRAEKAFPQITLHYIKTVVRFQIVRLDWINLITLMTKFIFKGLKLGNYQGKAMKLYFFIILRSMSKKNCEMIDKRQNSPPTRPLTQIWTLKRLDIFSNLWPPSLLYVFGQKIKVCTKTYTFSFHIKFNKTSSHM